MSTAAQPVETATAPDELATYLKAAGDPLRLEILRVLARDSFAVLELCHIFQAKQSGLSHHLRVLANAGWVATRREGNTIFYRRAHRPGDAELAPLQQALFARINQTPLNGELGRRITEVQRERARTSQQFFADNAEKFREQQDLIASYPVYGDQVAELLADTPLHQRHTALEVGPGEGEFLAHLAPRFERVVALDNAPEMLAHARHYARDRELENVAFLGGDTTLAVAEAVRADCVVMNMVLHHTPSPADIFVDLARVMTPGAPLLVADLCRHEQTWAREACGDLWQGFEPEDFSRWAASAGLAEGRSIYFALRNGFQIQLRQFFKPLAADQ